MYRQISSNNRQTVLIMLLFFGLIGGILYGAGLIAEIAPQDFPIISAVTFGFLFIWTLVSYFYGARMILGFVGAKPVERKDYFDLYNIVENVSMVAGLPNPKIYIIEDNSLNAFATGRNPDHGVVCVTRGLLKKLDKRELEAVLSHEMGHIANYDIRLQLFVISLIGALSMLGEFMIRSGRHHDKKSGPIVLAGFFIYIVGGFIFYLIRLALSRNREYLADACGSFYTRDPEALALALEKIAIDPRIESADQMNTAAHLFISDPREPKLHKAFSKSSFWAIFSTHPAVEERIKRLRADARNAVRSAESLLSDS